MAKLPILLIHGYSDRGESFREAWEKILRQRGYDAESIRVCNYKTLTNEVTIKDLAEGLERALRATPGLNSDEPFDAVVHSTGMLVIRSWLTVPTYSARLNRLKHLIALAPATFGSPLAHKGRSWAGALFKGNKDWGPDFMEAGDLVLDGLELGSRFTWDLAHVDMLGKETFYGPDRKTPFVFIFCGNKAYSGLRGLANEPGTDGTVRWAGCPLNARKIVLDFTRGPESADRIQFPDWTNEDIPLIPIDGLNHGSIVSKPTEFLVDLVESALAVNGKPAFEQWKKDAAQSTRTTLDSMTEWQQFVIHAVDERNDPITDYNVELETPKRSLFRSGATQAAEVDVHAYGADKSFRCFHVNLDKLRKDAPQSLTLHVMASSGSRLVGYHGFDSDKSNDSLTVRDPLGKWDGKLDLTHLLSEGAEVKFFYPFTTTLVELRLNREPMPLDVTRCPELFGFLPRNGR